MFVGWFVLVSMLSGVSRVGSSVSWWLVIVAGSSSESDNTQENESDLHLSRDTNIYKIKNNLFGARKNSLPAWWRSGLLMFRRKLIPTEPNAGLLYQVHDQYSVTKLTMCVKCLWTASLIVLKVVENFCTVFIRGNHLSTVFLWYL